MWTLKMGQGGWPCKVGHLDMGLRLDMGPTNTHFRGPWVPWQPLPNFGPISIHLHGPLIYVHQDLRKPSLVKVPFTWVFHNVFRTGSVIEPEKLPVHGSLVGPVVRPLSNRWRYKYIIYILLKLKIIIKIKNI